MSVQGTVESLRTGETEWRPVKLNDTYSAGDQIRVRHRSRADLTLLDRTVVRLNEDTTITLQPVKALQTGVLDLIRGAVHFFSRGPRSLEVHTPFTIAGVRGTEFLVEVEPALAAVTVFEGTVVAENQAGSLTLAGGQSAVAEAGKPPVPRVVARPRDAVAWALYYPPVLQFRPGEFESGPGWQGMVRQSLEALGRGDLTGAFDAISGAPADVSDPRLFTYRSHLLLAVGRADEAAADIQRALSLSPENPDALALQAIVAIVQNDTARAFQVARRAVAAAPTSATAQVALSYAQQARFDLPGARASLRKAVELDPRNALAWARLAELHSSFGDLTASLEAASKAVALEPDLSRAQTVLGFAYLTRLKVAQAKEAFQKAIALDSADPIPRLGLGLAEIRDGDLSQGARDIEAAASLDPSNALVRSYLGKAYYEEKRTGLDEREYGMARQLDPLDPTPWFYSAIAEQASNRPVEALRDLEKAIELNDNRAVYRSRLLLDSDLAARSASLARIYSDLGFQQLALAEGFKSVEADPTSFSAHRFLADSYSVLPRHEIARVSELLQSQLLQPLTVGPIQTHLGESDLLLMGSSGPGSLSFNEFNPIFDRDRLAVQLGGLGGELGTGAGEAVAAGVYRNASFSVGYTHFQTDGFRRNADQKDDIANAFVQYQLGSDTGVQAEYRHRTTTYGDLQERFFSEDFFPGLRNREERDTVRLGARHDFSPGSTVIASASYQHADVHLRDDQVPDPGFTFVEFEAPGEKALGAEVQHLLRTRHFNLRSGFGYFHTDSEVQSTIGLGPPIFPAPVEFSSVTTTKMHHANAYAYADIRIVDPLTLSVGASFDQLSGDLPITGNINQPNPKAGVIWTPAPGTTIRAAAFRTLKRTLTTNQTVEPTQVAGFNQFFDDPNLSSAWRYGGAIDQKLTRDLFGGAEFSGRKVSIPTLDYSVDPANPSRIDATWTEKVGRAYLFWTPGRWVALRAEYLFEHDERDVLVADGATKVDTHRVPLGVNVFHPSGLGASASATFVRQKGDFGGFSASVPVRPGSDTFWLVDVALRYRLPGRHGFASVGATNLLDERFSFFDTDVRNVSIQPRRFVFASLTVALP